MVRDVKDPAHRSAEVLTYPEMICNALWRNYETILIKLETLNKVNKVDIA